jgi:hypothetical protein
MSSFALNARAVQGVAGGVSDEKQIELLMNRLTSNEKAQDLLDPSFPKEKLNDQIQHFTGHYEISLVTRGPIQISGMMANVPVHIIFNTSIGSSNEEKFEGDRNIDFVLRDGHWYFANYNFLNLTPMEYLFDIGLLLIAVIWLCGTWLEFNSLRRQRMGGSFIQGLFSDYFHALNPFTWLRKETKEE